MIPFSMDTFFNVAPYFVIFYLLSKIVSAFTLRPSPSVQCHRYIDSGDDTNDTNDTNDTDDKPEPKPTEDLEFSYEQMLLANLDELSQNELKRLDEAAQKSSLPNTRKAQIRQRSC